MKKIEKFKTFDCYGILVNRANFLGEELIYKDGNYYFPLGDLVEVETDESTCSVSYVTAGFLYSDNLENFMEKTDAEGLIISPTPEGMKVSVIYNIEEE